jgi:hypothetical protein
MLYIRRRFDFVEHIFEQFKHQQQLVEFFKLKQQLKLQQYLYLRRL